MTLSPDHAGAAFRRCVYGLLLVLCAGTLLGRLASVRSSRGDTPLLSANDRSRWSTIRALVDEGTYAIDKVIFTSPGVRDPQWYTIDLVQHLGPDGRPHYYSSKPTLLTTLFAAPYWLIKSTSGISLAEKPYYVVRLTLLVVNALPMLMFLALLSRLVEASGRTNWSRIFVMSAAAFATPLTTFSVTLNNHTPAAMFVLASVAAAWAIWQSAQPRWWLFSAAGLFAPMAVACELPALSFFALILAALAWKSPRQTALYFAPPALLILLAIPGSNYLAHGTWSTPYAHRGDGPVVARIPRASIGTPEAGRLDPQLRQTFDAAGLKLSPDTILVERPLQRGYVLRDPLGENRYALRADADTLVAREWDNWYEYEGSYWSTSKRGVDRGEPARLVYALHALIGHHGVFSLTPIWLISIVGAAIWSLRGNGPSRGVAMATALLTVVCLTFYIVLRGQEDRNYGGVSCCFRWAIWLIPLWLLCMLPALDAIATRPRLRWLALVLLLISVFSATYNSANPWSHPWLFDYWTHLGWIKY